MNPLSIAQKLQEPRLSTNSLNFFVKGDEYHSFMDEDLPTPSYLVPSADGYHIGWYIDGYTHTTEGIKFRDDVLTKIALSLNATIKSQPPKDIHNAYYCEGHHKLSDLDPIQDLRTATRGLDLLHSGDDIAFNVIRAEAYKMKRQGILDHDLLLAFSLRTIPELDIKKRSYSDIKSKVRNVFAWTNRYYNAGTKKRISTMTRTEAAHNATACRMILTKDKVFDYLKTLQSMGTDLARLSTNFISNVLSISWRTARQYVAMFGLLEDKGYLLKEHIPLMKQLKVITLNEAMTRTQDCLWLTTKEVFSMPDHGNMIAVLSFNDPPSRPGDK